MKVFIGIDVGVNTGVAIQVNGNLEIVCSCDFFTATDLVKNYKKSCFKLKVYVEDPRKRKWFGNNEKKVQASRMGVGSVKRDAQLWEDFLKREGIDYVLVAPKSNKTKLKSDDFKKITKWTRQTNEHGRDAAMLIFGR